MKISAAKLHLAALNTAAVTCRELWSAEADHRSVEGNVEKEPGTSGTSKAVSSYTTEGSELQTNEGPPVTRFIQLFSSEMTTCLEGIALN